MQVTSGEGLNAYGAVTWGQLFIYQGFNERVGWMHASSGLDNRDEFAETFARLPDGRLGLSLRRDLRPVGLKPVTIRYRTPSGALAARDFHHHDHAARPDHPQREGQVHRFLRS